MKFVSNCKPATHRAATGRRAILSHILGNRLAILGSRPPARPPSQPAHQPSHSSTRPPASPLAGTPIAPPAT